MSGNSGTADIYEAVIETARRMGVTPARDTVRAILSAYGDAFTHAMPLALRSATDAQHTGDLDCRFVTHPKNRNPYPLALSKGLTPTTDHPVGALLSSIEERFPVDGYGIDFGVVNGFAKVYAGFPPDDLQKLPELAAIPAMPRGLADRADFFRQHGLDDKVAFTAIDYPHRTVNVYFNDVPPACREADGIRTMLHDLGLPEPSEHLLALAGRSFGLYTTLDWESPGIRRLCFGVTTTDLSSLPVPVDPRLEKFAQSVPYGGPGRKYVYGVAATATGEYHKLETHYKWNPGTVAFI
ncbi:prenyltransferase [Streptomyces roseirectus]|uniref:Prenyltransferase n=1 Tax=Streptomyces roseirectus TaxID=2768066 RepID=A0A7H0IPL1_9ACTN|nr:aromatic prenyltransferase [Streptomyces roseirectus]QNP74727.1 prenyltransferase [Streptomyces roseirectus]